MITKTKVNKYTNYSDEGITAKGDFSSCVTIPLENLKNFRDSIVEFEKLKKAEKERRANLIVSKNKLLSISDSDLRDAYFLLGKKGKDNIKRYFNTTPAKVMNNMDKTTELLDRLLTKIDAENHDELNDFKDKFKNILSELKEIVKDIYNKDMDIKLYSKKTEVTLKEWNFEYKILKLRVEAECVRTNIDYRIFFYDLVHNINSSSSNNTNKEKESEKEDNNSSDTE